jgi:hypothetical protein
MKKINTLLRLNNSRYSKWLRKFGLVSFLFFLFKGLAWLTVSYLILR